MKKKSLKQDFLNAAAQNPSEWAHCIVDVQREYCDPRYEYNPEDSRGSSKTRKVAEKIATLAPRFRQAGYPTYIVYFDDHLYERPEYAKGGLYKIKARPEKDTMVVKNDNSAFKGSDIDDRLRQQDIKGLIISGFNLNACVYSTAMDAVDNGYKVVIMGDCVGNDRTIYRKGTRTKIRELLDKGVVFAGSHQVLS